MLPGETITTCIIIYEPLTPPSCACIGSTGSRRSNSPSAVSNPKKIYRWTGRRRRRKIKLSTTRVLMIFERELESLLCPIRVNFYGNFREKLYSKFLKLVLPFQPLNLFIENSNGKIKQAWTDLETYFGCCHECIEIV